MASMDSQATSPDGKATSQSPAQAEAGAILSTPNALKNANAASAVELPACRAAADIMDMLDHDGHIYKISSHKGPFHALRNSGLSIHERLLAASCINERHHTDHKTGLPAYVHDEALPTGQSWIKTAGADSGAKPAPAAPEAPPAAAAPAVADTAPEATTTAQAAAPPANAEAAAAPKPLPEKLWNPEEAVQPVVDLFNQGKISEATASLKALQDDAPQREIGAWRHEIEVLNQKVDPSKLDMQDLGQIMGVDKSGNLVTASADLLKEQSRQPGNPSKPTSQFDLWLPDTNSGQLASLDPDGTSQIDRVAQYKQDVEGAKALRVTPDQMQIKDNITPIVEAFKSGDIAGATAKLQAMQEADKSQEKQMWLRHIEAVNANLDFNKLGLKDCGQIVGVDDQGRLLTASAKLDQVQTRDGVDANKIIKQANPNGSPLPFDWALGDPSAPSLPADYNFGDPKTAAQIAAVKDVVQEANQTNLARLGPGMHDISFTVDGEQREAQVFIPDNLDPGKKAPVAYVLHGAGPPPEKGVSEDDTHASQWAEKNHAIVVYALAEEHTQPVGNLGGVSGLAKLFRPDQDYHAWQTMPNSGLNETRLTYDDVHYIKALDAIVSRQANVDQSRKLIFTFSDGSGVSKNAAVAIGASAVIEDHGGIKADYQLPASAGIAYFAVNGEKDPVLPRAGASVYNGVLGNWEARWPKLANADPTRNFYEFAVANGCSGAPKVTKGPGMIRTEYSANQCTANMPVVEMDRPNDGHVIDNPNPSFLSRVFGLFLGQKDTSYDAFAATADEALKYPRQGS